jgi:CheY-like chemotaxis protein/HPt (histidine-containing phosphotransfer) domain-containing protein
MWLKRLSVSVVVDVAANGQEAVEAVAAAGAAYDVVLMDLQMAVMDGFAATRVIRYEMGLKTLPIVAMTANAMASDREAALAAGMNDHVGKPFDLNQLVQVLRVQAGRGAALVQAVTQGTTLPDSVLQVADRVEVDINAALKRLGGKRDVYHRMLQSFVHDLQAMPAQLRSAAPPDGRCIVHTFKGLTATLGARALSARAADLEKAMVVDSDWSSAQYQRAVDDLCSAMVQAQAALAVLVDALAQDAGAESSRSENPGAANLAAVRGQLQLLVSLLERQDMEALNAMAELQAQWGAGGIGESAALEQAMAALDFEAALPLARALGQKLSAV